MKSILQRFNNFIINQELIYHIVRLIIMVSFTITFEESFFNYINILMQKKYQDFITQQILISDFTSD